MHSRNLKWKFLFWSFILKIKPRSQAAENTDHKKIANWLKMAFLNRFYISATKGNKIIFCCYISFRSSVDKAPIKHFSEKNLKFTWFSRLSTNLTPSEKIFFTQFQMRVIFSLSKINHNNEVIIATIIFKINL